MASLQKLKELLDLREIVSESEKLIDRGDYSVMLCPFHEEKTPSCRVTQYRYHCFGCGADGDLIKWLQHINDNCSFQEALEDAHERAGLPYQSRQMVDLAYSMPDAPDYKERIARCRQRFPYENLVRKLVSDPLGIMHQYVTLEVKEAKPGGEINFLCDFFRLNNNWSGKLYALRCWEELCEKFGQE